MACVVVSLARTVLSFAELRSLHEVRRAALTDHLTGLPNRRALSAEMDGLVRDGRTAALILLDLDGFKAVNDGLGHRAGDDLLRRLGERLPAGVAARRHAFRLGGDEFAVLLPDADVEAADECARRMHQLVFRPVLLDDGSVQVGASLGVAAASDQAATIDDLLHRADCAMYEAKSALGGVRRFRTSGEVPEEVTTGSGDLVFRARVTRDGRVVTAVALARDGDSHEWRPAGLTALDEACAAAALWWETSRVPAELSVSASDLTGARPADRVAAALLRAGLPPRRCS